MRAKLLLLIAAATFMLAASSCQKKYCFECTTTRYFIINNDTSNVEQERKSQCDITVKEAKKIEENGSSTINYFKDGVPMVETQNTDCDYN